MGLLQPAENQTAFLKLGLQGFEGSGKTHLACEFAKEMTLLTKGSKVAFFDTEKGADFHIKRFKDLGIQLYVTKSRSFLDLLTVIEEAESNGFSFLIIDSITHVWREITAAYKAKKKKEKLTMNDWMYLKDEWARFTHAYVNSSIHIAMCGRAGYEYDFDEDEETGKKEIVKSGTKMKAEGETGFEPDLLIETYKVPIAETLTDKKAKKKSKGFINRCVVIKDRSDTINGQIFDKPKFKDFLPAIKFLNLGGKHVGADLTRTSQSMISNPDRSWAENKRQVEIALEELKDLLVKCDLEGRSDETKKKRIAALEKYFKTSSGTKLASLSLDELKEGMDGLKKEYGFFVTEAQSEFVQKLEEFKASAETDVQF